MRKLLFVLIILVNGIFIPALAHETDETGLPLNVGEPAPNFQLIDQNSQLFDFESLKGKVVLLTFIYTQCPDVCPLLTTYMRQAQDLLGDKFSQEVAFVSISVDPDDTPEVLREYAKKHRADLSGWKFLTSTNIDDIKHVAKDYGIFFEKEEDGEYSHSMFTYLLDKEMNVSKMYFGIFLNSNDIEKDISALISSPSNLFQYLFLGSIGGAIVIGGSFFLYKKKRKKIIDNVFEIFNL